MDVSEKQKKRVNNRNGSQVNIACRENNKPAVYVASRLQCHKILERNSFFALEWTLSPFAVVVGSLTSTKRYRTSMQARQGFFLAADYGDLRT